MAAFLTLPCQYCSHIEYLMEIISLNLLQTQFFLLLIYDCDLQRIFISLCHFTTPYISITVEYTTFIFLKARDFKLLKLLY